MKRLLVIAVALLAGLTALALRIAATRPRPITARTEPAPVSNAKLATSAIKNVRETTADLHDTAGAQAEQRVISFARNPMPMPPFLVRDLDGGMISTAGLQGKVVLLTFWATWCPPCRQEIPEMIELASRYKDRLEIIGVSLDDAPPEEVQQFAKRAGINYPIIMASREILSEYGGLPALPTTFVVNAAGQIVQKHVGLYPIEVYEDEIRALLGLPVNATVKTFDDVGQIFLKNAARATELPGVSFAGLTPAQKKAALKRLNSENCNCGCALTLAQCRINDTTCPVSKQLVEKVMREIAATSPAAETTSNAPTKK